jgi:hypothetical protein
MAVIQSQAGAEINQRWIRCSDYPVHKAKTSSLGGRELRVQNQDQQETRESATPTGPFPNFPRFVCIAGDALGFSV